MKGEMSHTRVRSPRMFPWFIKTNEKKLTGICYEKRDFVTCSRVGLTKLELDSTY